MLSTHNDLSLDTRSQVVDRLNARLASSLDLSLQVKQAHWNVKGPNFIGLHKLFDEIYDDVVDYSDLMAERIVQLGGVAGGTIAAVETGTELRAYPRNATAWTEHVESISTALATFAASVRADIDAFTELGDAGTADISTEISRGVDKWLWMVSAHAG